MFKRHYLKLYLFLTFCCGCLVASSLPAHATPAVQVSDKFIELFKKTLKKIASDGLKKKVCNSLKDHTLKRSCDGMANILLAAIDTIRDKEKSSKVFEKIIETVSQIGIEKLIVEQVMKKMEPLLENYLPTLFGIFR